jgi:hypothetical protein
MLMDVMELVMDHRLARQVFLVQPFDELVSWLFASVVRMVAVTQRELAARRRMRADPPAARLVTVVLPDHLIHAGGDRADNAELGKVRSESRPKRIVLARLISDARVHLKPVPD